MLNDKLIIEMSCNYIYRLQELANEDSTLSNYIKKHYPYIKIIDIHTSFENSGLGVMTIQDINSKDVAIIYQGSNSMDDWRNDNLNNFLNKNVSQYEVALDYYNFITEKAYRITHIGGNSLGGGCAQYVGIRNPQVRSLCINASPLVSSNVLDTNNIINIRVNADLLHRCVMLDPERYENGYVGEIKVINRSLYGEYDYYNSIELAHKGSISFPYTYIYNHYNVTSLEELKSTVDSKTYQEFSQLRLAPTLSQFMTFDLITNNMDETGNFDLDELQDNFATRIKEINKSLLEYHLPNLELKIGKQLIEFNDSMNVELKSIIKYSLLSLTKKTDPFYDNIYFVIEKSVNYIYKLITASLLRIDESMDPTKVSRDYEKIINDIDINKKAINEIIDNLIMINDELFTLDKFSLMKIITTPKASKFEFNKTAFLQDYKTMVYDKIDESIENNIVNNRLFSEQLQSIFTTALKASKIPLSIPGMDKATNMTPSDIDYILDRYSITKIIQDGFRIFKEDVYEAILANSLLFIYQSNIRCVNEQLEQLLLTLDNLKYYVDNNEIKYNKKRTDILINETYKYINELIEYNNSNYNF